MVVQMLASNWRMLKQIQDLYLNHYSNRTYLAQIQIQPTLLVRIRKAQAMNQESLKHFKNFTSKEAYA